ncbi:MAG TPA: hypothetical protein PKZ76_02815 [Xanthomonadaceae bacterium]|nr:hypothetical protein [Xanthomonadaceae bacterium]
MNRYSLISILVLVLILVACAGPTVIETDMPAMSGSAQTLQPPPRKRPDSPGERAALHLAKRLPVGAIELDPAMYAKAEAQAAALPLFDSKSARFVHRHKAVAGGWEWLGPVNVAGRMRALAFDPRDPSRMLTGGVSGGVWESTDSGHHWRALSDDAVNINIGALAIDPVEPDTIYAGTGELYRNSERPYAAMWGRGILRSTDGGRTWPQLLATQGPDFRYVSDIVISHHDHRRLYAATNTGVWRSDDRGRSFVQVLRPTDEHGQLLYEGCTDLTLLPGHPGDHLLATCASRSTDDRYWLPGTLLPPACSGPCPASVFLSERAEHPVPQWQLVLSEPGMGRTELAVAPSNPSIVYALSASTVPGFDRNGNGHGDYDNGLHAVFRSDDGGRSWDARLRNSSADRLSTFMLSYAYGFDHVVCNQGSFIYGAGWYNMAIAVHPLDADVVWVGGMELYRSDNGARTFGKASEWWPKNTSSYVHADMHVLAFHPLYGQGHDALYVATDGGIAVTHDDTAEIRRGTHASCLGTGHPTPPWQEIVSGLGTTQYYTGTTNASGTMLMGGLQDNGTLLWREGFPERRWTHILGGDGASVAIDPGDNNVIYASSQNVAIRRSVDGGASFEWASNGIQDTPIFIMPYVLDRRMPARLYAGGTRVWRTNNQGRNWEPASAVLGTSFSHRISAIDVSPVDNRHLLAGNRIGIYRSTQAGSTHAATTLESVSPRAGWVSSLRFDLRDAAIAFATYSTFGGDHVWRSDDAGATWTAIDGTGSGRLPDVPVHDIAIHPDNRDLLYVATDIGIFVTVNGGQSWARENSGFANVIVERLAVADEAPGGPLLHAFTYGRGVWRVPMADLTGAPTHVIDAGLSGTFFDPEQDGHGWLLEAIESDGVLAVLATWYTYVDGQPVWLIGVGIAEDEVVRVPLQITRGGGFPPQFDPSQVERIDWGEAEFRFSDRDHGQVIWTSHHPGFGAGSMPLVRLAQPADGGPTQGLMSCHSGTWFQPAEDGHGLQVQVLGEGDQRNLLLVWYAYQDGAQRWMIGSGPVQGDSAVVDLISADGAQFPPAFDPAQVERRPWGTVLFTATGPDSARIEWHSVQTGFGSGSLDLVRLTSMLGQNCGPP